MVAAGHRIRDAGHKSGDSAYIQGVSRFHATAETHIVDHSGVNARAFDRLFHGNAANDRRVQIFQSPAESSHRRSTSGNNDYVFHSISFQLKMK